MCWYYSYLSLFLDKTIYLMFKTINVVSWHSDICSRRYLIVIGIVRSRGYTSHLNFQKGLCRAMLISPSVAHKKNQTSRNWPKERRCRQNFSFKLLLTKICMARESQTSYVCSSNPFLRLQGTHRRA